MSPADLKPVPPATLAEQAYDPPRARGLPAGVPKLGWQVAPLDFDQFDEIYDLRVLIECHAAQALCEAEPRDALHELAAVWLAPASERSTDPDTVRDLDEQFHHELVLAAGNREMARVHREITDRIRIVRRTSRSRRAWKPPTTSTRASCAPSRAAAPTRRSACCAPTSSRASSRCATSRGHAVPGAQAA